MDGTLHCCRAADPRRSRQRWRRASRRRDTGVRQRSSVAGVAAVGAAYAGGAVLALTSGQPRRRIGHVLDAVASLFGGIWQPNPTAPPPTTAHCRPGTTGRRVGYAPWRSCAAQAQNLLLGYCSPTNKPVRATQPHIARMSCPAALSPGPTSHPTSSDPDDLRSLAPGWSHGAPAGGAACDLRFSLRQANDPGEPEERVAVDWLGSRCCWHGIRPADAPGGCSCSHEPLDAALRRHSILRLMWRACRWANSGGFCVFDVVDLTYLGAVSSLGRDGAISQR